MVHYFRNAYQCGPRPPGGAFLLDTGQKHRSVGADVLIGRTTRPGFLRETHRGFLCGPRRLWAKPPSAGHYFSTVMMQSGHMVAQKAQAMQASWSVISAGW